MSKNNQTDLNYSLTPEAQAVLPWLAWFQGGAFEERVLSLGHFEEEQWTCVKEELKYTGLLEEVPTVGGRLYLRLHPVLASAERMQTVPDLAKAVAEYLALYSSLARTLAEVHFLDGGRGATTKEMLEEVRLEVNNMVLACSLAFNFGEYGEGVAIGVYVGKYYMKECPERWAEWEDQLWARVIPLQGNSEWAGEVMTVVRAYAQSLMACGRKGEAADLMEQVVYDMEGKSEEPSLLKQLALCRGWLGQIWAYDEDTRERGMAELHKAAKAFELSGSDWNLAVTLGSLSSLYGGAGEWQKVLEVATKAIEASKRSGYVRGEALGLMLTGSALVASGWPDRGLAYFVAAEEAAGRSGDKQLRQLCTLGVGMALSTDRPDKNIQS